MGYLSRRELQLVSVPLDVVDVFVDARGEREREVGAEVEGEVDVEVLSMVDRPVFVGLDIFFLS